MANVQVQVQQENLPPAKKGKFKGRKRNDVFVARVVTSGGIKLTKALSEQLPDYVVDNLNNGKKVVVYKNQKSDSAYQKCIQAFGLPNPYDKQEEEGGDEVEQVQKESEDTNAKMEEIRTLLNAPRLSQPRRQRLAQLMGVAP